MGQVAKSISGGKRSRALKVLTEIGIVPTS